MLCTPSSNRACVAPRDAHRKLVSASIARAAPTARARLALAAKSSPLSLQTLISDKGASAGIFLADVLFWAAHSALREILQTTEIKISKKAQKTSHISRTEGRNCLCQTTLSLHLHRPACSLQTRTFIKGYALVSSDPREQRACAFAVAFYPHIPIIFYPTALAF